MGAIAMSLSSLFAYEDTLATLRLVDTWAVLDSYRFPVCVGEYEQIFQSNPATQNSHSYVAIAKGFGGGKTGKPFCLVNKEARIVE